MKIALAFASALALIGCGGQKVEPVIASPAGEGAYAMTFPQALGAAATGFSERQSQVHKILATFKEFPDRLKAPAWPRVREVVERADEVGRSYSYVDRTDRVEGAHGFFETERDEIGRKVGGSAMYLVKKQNCEVEVGGAVNASLKESVDKQLEKELRDASDAHLLIERYKTALKKENVAELEKQADAIEFASFAVHVDLVNQKLKLVRMIDNADKVKGTEQDFIATEKKWQAEKGLTDADKKESQDRIAAMQKASASLDAAIAQAQSVKPHLEDEIAKIQKEYDDALADLIARISAKK